MKRDKIEKLNKVNLTVGLVFGMCLDFFCEAYIDHKEAVNYHSYVFFFFF